ncbi:hypothetical protein MSAN_01138500 [Mycena sanguinolenta]|uniref:Uncharacterized protein n=1 Tax=Mycena sanguinolenta TaxID=230812 RepID=A0A8H7D6W5_9AGAR|nr:hypothetical protein MSAN_01138500 [Mycena sanguinolenta]
MSTVFAAGSSHLFSVGLRRAIAFSLTQPTGMTLGALSSTISLASRGFIFRRRQWKWSLVSIALLLLTGIQTSGWTTLIHPVPVVLEEPLHGTELDLASSALGTLQETGDPGLKYCIHATSQLPLFTVGDTDSGHATIKADIGMPASFDFLDQTFNVSTGGILPATFDDVVLFGEPTKILATLQDIPDLTIGLSSNYSVTQQGFSADVSCRAQTLSNSTRPSLIISSHSEDWNYSFGTQLNFSRTITWLGVASNCSIPDPESRVNTQWTIAAGLDYVLMVACPELTTKNYTLMFAASGKYEFMNATVCTLAPKLTTVTAYYSNVNSSSRTISTTTHASQPMALDSPAALSAISTVSTAVFLAQGAERSVLGDELYSLKVKGNSTEDTLRNIEEYIRGVTEYSGSIFRACLSNVTNPNLAEVIAANPTSQINGTYSTYTMGWERLPSAAIWSLVPGTLIATMTIVVVLAATVLHAGTKNASVEVFNPLDPIQVMAATAAGGLSDVLEGADDKYLTSESMEDVPVVLEHISGRRVALVPV